MKKHRLRNTLIGIGLLMLIAIIAVLGLDINIPRFYNPNAHVSRENVGDRNETYSIDNKDTSNVFTNKIDGYRINLPKSAQVSFDSNQLKTHIDLDSSTTLDIYYTPEITYGGSSSYYLEVSTGGDEKAPNAFSNTTDHKVFLKEEVKTAGFKSIHMAWDRTPIKSLENDKSHYYTIDMAVGPLSAITFMFKSDQIIDDEKIAQFKVIGNSFEKFNEGLVSPVIDKDLSSPRSEDDLNKQTKAVKKKYFSPNSPLKWGIFSPEYSNFNYGHLKNLEKDLDTHFSMIVHYMDVTRSDPEKQIAPVLKQAKAEGRSVELTIQTINPPEGPNQVYDILNGNYDDYFMKLSDVIKESDSTILLRIGNEMNGDWCQYSPVHLSRDPDIYIAFYQYLVDFFEKTGASKQMLYVWNPNSESYPVYTWNSPHLVWPGNSYVDIVGLTAYNTGTYYSHEQWRSFDELYRATYEEYREHYTQPLMITEFASSSVGGDKTAWVKDMLKRIEKDYPDIKVAIWWDHEDYDPKDLKTVSRPYHIDEPRETKEAFKDYFHKRN